MNAPGWESGWHALAGFSIALLAVRITLLVGIAALATAWGRRAAAASRHLWWVLALAGVLLLPLAAAFAPRFEAPWLPAAAPGSTLLVPGSAPASPGPSEPPAADPATRRQPATGAVAASPGGLWRPVLLGGWLAAALALAVRTLLLCGSLRRLRLRARPLGEGHPVAVETRDLARRLGIGRRLRLVESPDLPVPATWGLLRPVLSLPAGIAGMAVARRRGILAHELAHVVRGDSATALLAELAAAIGWFHPLVWWGVRRAREESELACDNAVLAMGVRASDYAAELLAMARAAGRRRAPAFTAPAMAGGRLDRRIRALFGVGARRRPPARWSALAARFAAALVLGGLAAVEPVPARPGAGEVRTAVGPGSEAVEWPPQQLRWGLGSAAGGLFVEGRVDLAALASGAPGVEGDGVLVVFERNAAGGWRSHAAWTDASGHVRTLARDGDGLGPGTPPWVWRSLSRVATDWRQHAETIIGGLNRFAEVADRPVLGTSGSLITGLPGTSRNPDTGVVQSSWMEGSERIGVLVQGPIDLGPDGRTVAALPNGGFFAAWGWDRERRRLRLLEIPGGPSGLRVLYSRDGEASAFDAEAGRWLARVLARLPERRPWPGWRSPAA